MFSFDSGSAALLQALAGASVRVLILAGLAWVGLRWWRGRTAPMQHAVWAAVMVAMLLLPLGRWLPPVTVVPAVMDPAPWLRVPAEVSVSVAPAGTRVQGERRVISIDERGMVADAAGPRIVWGWMSGVAGVYLVAVLGMLGHLAMGSFFAARLVGRSLPVREERVKTALEEVARESEVPMPWPSVLESVEVKVPVVVGSQAPAILLPVAWREWDDWKLRAVLAHELAHIRRGDGRTVFLTAVTRAVFWFHPLAWWLQRRLALLCEQACDDAAVRTLGDAPRYAQVLCEVAAAGAGQHMGAAQAMAGASNVHHRIERLLEGETWSAGVASWRARIAIAAMAVPVVLGLALVQAQEPMVDPGDVGPGWKWQEDGHRTSEEQARELEMQVVREPASLGLRARLIAYYIYNANFDAAGVHVLWVIANRPESGLAGAMPGVALAGLGAPGEMGRLGDRVSQLWKEQAARRASDVRVLGHAAMALQSNEPEEAERLLLRARQLDGTNAQWVSRLAALYNHLIAAEVYERVGSRSMTEQRQKFEEMARARGWGRSRMRMHAEMGWRVRRELAEGTDLELAGRVGAMMTGLLVYTTGSARGEYADVHRTTQRELGEYAEGLLSRASAADAARWTPALVRLRSWRLANSASNGE